MTTATAPDNITILVFGNANSGKKEILNSLAQAKPTNNAHSEVLKSSLDLSGNLELILGPAGHQGPNVTCKILDTGIDSDTKPFQGDGKYIRVYQLCF